MLAFWVRHTLNHSTASTGFRYGGIQLIHRNGNIFASPVWWHGGCNQRSRLSRLGRRRWIFRTSLSVAWPRTALRVAGHGTRHGIFAFQQLEVVPTEAHGVERRSNAGRSFEQDVSTAHILEGDWVHYLGRQRRTATSVAAHLHGEICERARWRKLRRFRGTGRAHGFGNSVRPGSCFQ